jgi:hypothetical protein
MLVLTTAATAQDYTGTDGPPIRFRALLSADEQTITTESPGVGCALFVLDRPTLRIEWTVIYKELTSAATAANVHGPQGVGSNAGVLWNLAPDGMKSPLTGSIVLNDGQLEYLLTDRVYVNILSRGYPEGELRGQIRRLRPEQVDEGC